MEFNVLPRAKILSPYAKHKTRQTTNQTVNVILPQQPAPKPVEQPVEPIPKPPVEPIEPKQTEPAPTPEQVNPYKELESGEVDYNPEAKVQYVTREVNLEEPSENLSQTDAIATINFLKLVVAAYMGNPIKYNGYVICSVPVLENLIETLTGCDDCNIEIADIEAGCCGTSSKGHIVPIGKIWVNVNGANEIFKYKYSQYLQTFEQYNISLKFAYSE